MIPKILVLLVQLYFKISYAQNTCSTDKSLCDDTSKIISLTSIQHGWSSLDKSSQIFFIESSGRDHLLPRQTCAVESALRNANIPLVIVGKCLF